MSGGASVWRVWSINEAGDVVFPSSAHSEMDGWLGVETRDLLFLGSLVRRALLVPNLDRIPL